MTTTTWPEPSASAFSPPSSSTPHSHSIPFSAFLYCPSASFSFHHPLQSCSHLLFNKSSLSGSESNSKPLLMSKREKSEVWKGREKEGVGGTEGCRGCRPSKPTWKEGQVVVGIGSLSFLVVGGVRDGIFGVISRPDWKPLKPEDSSSEGNDLHFYRSRAERTEWRGKGKLWHLLWHRTKLSHPFKGLSWGFQYRRRASERKKRERKEKSEKESNWRSGQQPEKGHGCQHAQGKANREGDEGYRMFLTCSQLVDPPRIKQALLANATSHNLYSVKDLDVSKGCKSRFLLPFRHPKKNVCLQLERTVVTPPSLIHNTYTLFCTNSAARPGSWVPCWHFTNPSKSFITC